MISRQWRGLAKRAHAGQYLEHLRQETLPLLHAIPGFVDASVLQREVNDGIEFLVVTRWISLSAVEQFAGPDLTCAVVPEKVQSMMVDYDQIVRHYEVVE